jgi:hypothetical protein
MHLHKSFSRSLSSYVNSYALLGFSLFSLNDFHVGEGGGDGEED